MIHHRARAILSSPAAIVLALGTPVFAGPTVLIGFNDLNAGETIPGNCTDTIPAGSRYRDMGVLFTSTDGPDPVLNDLTADAERTGGQNIVPPTQVQSGPTGLRICDDGEWDAVLTATFIIPGSDGIGTPATSVSIGFVSDAAGSVHLRAFSAAGALLMSTMNLTGMDVGDDIQVYETLSVSAPAIVYVKIDGFDDLIIDEFIFTRASCSDADLVTPFGVLDFNDVLAFLDAFAAMEPAADLAEPVGTFNFNDMIEFLTLFAAGCP